MAILFTSDLHFGHKNILPTRPQFQSIEEHDETLINNWNAKVKGDDDVYILGDLSYRCSRHISYYLSRMKGKKHLIVGNHDDDWMRNVMQMSDYFESVDYLKTIKLDGIQITLCHYPMLEWPGSRYKEVSYLIHGHIHGLTNDIYEYIKEHQPHALNAGVDVNDFKPITLEELKANCEMWYARGKNK